MQDKNVKYYQELFTDVERVNRFARNIFLICSLFYGILGYMVYDEITREEIWKPLFYYGFLLLPVILMLLDYSENKKISEFRYTIFIPSMFFYLYILLLDIPFFYFVYALCMMGIAVLYSNIHFSRIVGIVLFCLHNSRI